MRQRRPLVSRKRGVIAAARARRPAPGGSRLTFQTDPWTRRLIRPLLITLVATAVGINLLVIAHIISPEQAWLSVAWLCFIAALEGAYTASWLNNPDSQGVDRGLYRAAEVLLLLVLSRIVSWVLFGPGLPTSDDIQLYLAAPLSFFMTGGFFTTAFVLLVSWGLAVALSRIFTQLDVSVYEVGFFTLPPSEQSDQADNRPIQIARNELQDQYVRLWLLIGMIMVVLAALSTYEVREFGTVANPLQITRLGMRPPVLLALLAYFLGGLWLMSHARLLRLNARWLMDGVAKDAELERAWQRSSLVVVAAIALIAAFLPIGSTLAISRILALLVDGIFYVIGLVYSLIGFLFASALSMLGGNAEQPLPIEPQPLPTFPPPPVPDPATPSPLLAFIFSSAFWAILIALLAGALLFFFRERGYKFDWGRMRTSWVTLAAALRTLWLRLRGRVRSTSRALNERLRVAGGPAGRALPPVSRPRFLRLGSLPPREQIRYYYLSTVRRAGERGVQRADSETPLEFIHDLKQNWPDAGADLEELTDAFLVARYSPRPIEPSVLKIVREHWKRVRDRLRGRPHD